MLFLRNADYVQVYINCELYRYRLKSGMVQERIICQLRFVGFF